MRIIKIISNGNLVEVMDDIDTSLDEVTNYLKDIMESDKIVTLIGKNSSAIIRPSSVTAINIFDQVEEDEMRNQAQPMKNVEQNNEHIDMIMDIDDAGE